MRGSDLAGILRRISSKRCVKLLSEMIRIDSVNPFGSEGRAEVDLARYLSDKLGKLGLEVEEQSVGNGRFNVIGSLEGREDGPTLMLNSHMDTVGAEGMEDPFNPELSEGVIHGRGSCDAKGPLTSMLAALGVLVKERKKLAGKIVLAAVCDEEYKSIGTERLVGKYRSDLAVVGEPTGLRLGISHRGFVWAKLVVRGRAAHGSVPEQGIDAIEKMADLITSFKELRRQYDLRPLHPLLGRPSLHMGTIKGGTEPSVVPDLCELIVERRTLPGESETTFMKEVKELVEEAEKKDPSLRAEISPQFQRFPFELDPDNLLIKTFEGVLKDVSGKKAVVCGLTGWTDAAIIHKKLKIPVCVFGPGEVKYAHSNDEQIKISEVVDAAKVYAALSASVCSKH